MPASDRLPFGRLGKRGDAGIAPFGLMRSDAMGAWAGIYAVIRASSDLFFPDENQNRGACLHRDADRPLRLARLITDKYILLMLLVFPLFTGFEGYRRITASKFIFFAAATALWLLCLAACAAGGRRAWRCFLSPALGGILAFLLAACLSALFSPYGVKVLLGAGRFGGLLTLLLYGCAAIGVAKLASPRYSYVICLALSVTGCCVPAVLQLLGQNPLRLFPSGLSYYDAHILYDGEFLGTIGNVDLLSAFLCLALPLFLSTYISAGGSTVWLLLPCGLGFFVLAVSRVSGGAVALLAVSAVMAPLLAAEQRRFSRTLFALSILAAALSAALAFHAEYDGRSAEISLRFGRAPLLMLGAAALLAPAAFLAGKARAFPSPSKLRRAILIAELLALLLFLGLVYHRPWGDGTVYELSRVLHGEIRDSFGSSRIRIWKAVLALVPERPLLGGGPDTLALRLNVVFSRLVPETGRTLTVSVDNAHCEYLGILADLGILGLLSYLAAMAASVFSRDRWRAKNAPLGLGLLCYWVQSLFGLGLCLVAPVMWIFWGLFLSEPGEHSRQT